MLDVHALTITPGAVLTLGSPGSVSAGGDGAQVAGVPIRGDAVLRMYGFHSPTADTIANLKLQSQDMVDPINGITFTPGAASLLNQHYDYTTLKYATGARYITAGTNTGVVAGHGFLIDEYNGQNCGRCVAGKRDMGSEIMVGALTFGGALTANTWGQMAFAPNTAIPNGQYAILGAYVSAIANAALLRFTHADFGSFRPGFPVSNFETISTATWDKICKDELTLMAAGEQFIYLGDVFQRPMCPVFSVSNAGTGLTMEMLSAQADTPVVNLVIAKVG